MMTNVMMCFPESVMWTGWVFGSCFTPGSSIIPVKQQKFNKLYLMNENILCCSLP